MIFAPLKAVYALYAIAAMASGLGSVVPGSLMQVAEMESKCSQSMAPAPYPSQLTPSVPRH